MSRKKLDQKVDYCIGSLRSIKRPNLLKDIQISHHIS